MGEMYVNLDDVAKLRKIFKKNQWLDFPNEETVFNNLCKILNGLSAEQKLLVYELTEKYLWISDSEYGKRFNKILDSVNEDLLKTCKKIYLFPIIKLEEEDNYKSGNHCIYLFKGLLVFNRRYKDINFEIIPDFQTLLDKPFKTDGSEIIFLIDDFIGTGDTFGETWAEVKKNKNICTGNIIVLSLVIQKEGLEVIQSTYGISTLYSELQKKGISDEYNSPEKEEKIKVMEDIEKYIKPKSFSFGYKKSEALVTMIRTPNNTFPFFWKESKIKGVEFSPPFPRF